MKDLPAYASDLAYIHDQGYGGFARNSAPGLLGHFHQAGIDEGLIVDLGCGSGIWSRELIDAGYQVEGVDISAAMIEIARARVPEAEFHIASFVRFPLPLCRAVTAMGEVFSYLFDAENSLASVRAVCRKAFAALAPGGLLIFDVAEPNRHEGRTQLFSEGDDWACLVSFERDESTQKLTRRIVTFRQIGDCYRRREELHVQQLFTENTVLEMLEEIGFQADSTRNYGEFALPQGVIGFIARKPLTSDSPGT